jgi:hypothetical protein
VKPLFFLGCIAALVGCAEGHPATSDSLADSIDVQSVGAPVQSSVTFTMEGGFAGPSPVSMAVAQPLVKLHTRGDRAELDGITLPLGDVTIPAQALPPKGLVLRNLVVKAPAAHAEILHAQEDALELRAHLPLSLDWSLQLDDGTLYPLGTVHTDPINVDVQVVRSGGRVTATVQASCLGTCWSVAGVAKMSNASLYLETAAEVTPAP